MHLLQASFLSPPLFFPFDQLHSFWYILIFSCALYQNLVMQAQHVKLILKYLKDHNCIESLLTLQRESGVLLHQCSKEVEFFRKIILKGDFDEAVTFVLTFENRIDEKDLKRIILDLYRQKLYELIEDPQQEQLRRIFEKDIVGYCTEEEFQELFNCLTYRSVSQIEGLKKWTPMRGRYECFESVVPYLELFNSVLKEEKDPQVPNEKLQTIIDAYYFPKGTIKQQPEAIFTKNKSILPSQTFAIEEEERKPQNKLEFQREAIKNSIMNMNLSGNYSQVKGKPNNSIVSNVSKLQEETEGKDKAQKQKQKIIDKSSVFDKIDKNVSVFNVSNVSDRRPRVNASLNGPMNQKIEGNVKIDNYLRNDPPSQDNTLPPSFNKPAKQLQKSQNFSQISQAPSAKAKRESPQPLFRQQNPVILNQLNELSSSELNQISEEERSEPGKSMKMQRSQRVQRGKEKVPTMKPSYIFSSKQEDHQLQQEIKRNIEYLQQSSSVIYKSKQELERQAFTFSQEGRGHQQETKVRKLTKLAAISDSKAIRTCQFSPSAAYFAVGTNSSVLKIFQVQRLFERNRYQELSPLYQIDGLHQKSIFCLDWSRTERALLTCSNDLQVKLTQIGRTFNEHRSTVIGKHDSCIRMARFSGQERMVSCGDDSVIKVWDSGKLKRCTTLKGHTNSVSAFKLHSENELYSVSKDMTIRRWDLRMGQNTATSRPQDSELTYIANNTDKIVVSHKDGNVSFFGADLQLEHSVQIHEEEIRSVQALRGESMLLTASFDGHIALFSQRSSHSPNYFQHNETEGDKVVFATFLHSTQFRGFASTSTLGLCHLYSYE